MQLPAEGARRSHTLHNKRRWNQSEIEPPKNPNKQERNNKIANTTRYTITQGRKLRGTDPCGTALIRSAPTPAFPQVRRFRGRGVVTGTKQRTHRRGSGWRGRRSARAANRTRAPAPPAAGPSAASPAAPSPSWATPPLGTSTAAALIPTAAAAASSSSSPSSDHTYRQRHRHGSGVRGSSAGGRTPPDSSNGAGGPQAGGSGGFDRGPRRRVLGLVSVREKQGESVERRRREDCRWRRGRKGTSVCMCCVRGCERRKNNKTFFRNASLFFSLLQIYYFVVVYFSVLWFSFHAFGFALLVILIYNCRLANYRSSRVGSTRICCGSSSWWSLWGGFISLTSFIHHQHSNVPV